jgi:hypothetical protein
MTSKFVCERCGTTWGWLTARHHHLRELFKACSEGRCDVVRMGVLGLKRWAEKRLVVV